MKIIVSAFQKTFIGLAAATALNAYAADALYMIYMNPFVVQEY